MDRRASPSYASGMSFTLVPDPPAVPSMRWLCEFASTMMMLRPALPFDDAMRCALLAHRGSWLLEAREAAELWLAAIDAVRQSQRPRGLLDS